MKNYLVTGASRGLGLEITKNILSSSDDNVVYAISRSKPENFERLQDAYGERLKFKSYDLGVVDEIKKNIFQDFIPMSISLDGFVNNAAVAYDDIVTNLNYEKLKVMYDVNVFAPMVITKNVLRNFLLHKKKGSIIHVSSISVHTGYKGLSMYASSKGALEAFSKNTAREWGSLGIRSNALVAGFMETEMSATLSKEQKDRIYKRTALKCATNVKSVSNMINFLLTDAAASVTGQSIFVDSGTI